MLLGKERRWSGDHPALAASPASVLGAGARAAAVLPTWQAASGCSHRRVRDYRELGQV